jgi:hypothetical protein
MAMLPLHLLYCSLLVKQSFRLFLNKQTSFLSLSLMFKKAFLESRL